MTENIHRELDAAPSWWLSRKMVGHMDRKLEAAPSWWLSRKVARNIDRNSAIILIEPQNGGKHGPEAVPS